MIRVSATHPHPTYHLGEKDFALVEAGEYGDYRVGGDAVRGYYASAPVYGCTAYFATPREAIRHLLNSNGCNDIRIVEGTAL
jgi:hypothetical protein